jgi:hypothetical protein
MIVQVSWVRTGHWKRPTTSHLVFTTLLHFIVEGELDRGFRKRTETLMQWYGDNSELNGIWNAELTCPPKTGPNVMLGSGRKIFIRRQVIRIRFHSATPTSMLLVITLVEVHSIGAGDSYF